MPTMSSLLVKQIEEQNETKTLLENEFFPLTGERLRQVWKSECVCVRGV